MPFPSVFPAAEPPSAAFFVCREQAQGKVLRTGGEERMRFSRTPESLPGFPPRSGTPGFSPIRFSAPRIGERCFGSSFRDSPSSQPRGNRSFSGFSSGRTQAWRGEGLPSPLPEILFNMKRNILLYKRSSSRPSGRIFTTSVNGNTGHHEKNKEFSFFPDYPPCENQKMLYNLNKLVPSGTHQKELRWQARTYTNTSSCGSISSI